jgi:hypothetical protein
MPYLHHLSQVQLFRFGLLHLNLVYRGVDLGRRRVQ